MGKPKVAQPTKATKLAKEAEVKTLSSVKGGAVTKPSQTPKSKSKELAKQVAAKSEKGEKKSKKPVKEPTPELSAESDSDDDSDEVMTSASSESSDEESDEEVNTPAVKANGISNNGTAKAADAETSESSESSDSEAEADAAPLAPTAAKVADTAVDSEGDSSDASGSSSGAESDVESEADSSEDDEADVKPGSVDAMALNGKLETVASEQVCPISWSRKVWRESNRSPRFPPTSRTTNIPPTPHLKQTRPRILTIQAMRRTTKNKRSPQPRSARLKLNLRQLPRKQRQMRWPAVSTTQVKGTSLLVTYLGT